MSKESDNMAEANDGSVADKVSLKKRIDKFIKFATKFCKRFKLQLAIAAAVIITLTAVYHAIPTVGVGDLTMVDINTKVRLKTGQTVKLKVVDVGKSTMTFQKL